MINVLMAAALGALAGLLIAMTGGTLLGGSLALQPKASPMRACISLRSTPYSGRSPPA